MRLAVCLLGLVLACSTIPGRAVAPEPIAWTEPDFVSTLGVLVRLPASCQKSHCLTLEMTDVMELDLLQSFVMLGWRAKDVSRCLRGVTVQMVDSHSWTCHTLQDGKDADVECVGSTGSLWFTEIALPKECAFEQGAQGPPYEHELAHVVSMCLGMPTDFDHVGIIWEFITGQRPCPSP